MTAEHAIRAAAKVAFGSSPVEIHHHENRLDVIVISPLSEKHFRWGVDVMRQWLQDHGHGEVEARVGVYQRRETE